MLVAERNGMMVASKLTAKSYVQDGLIAMWDGIENVGWGRHEDSPAIWKNLVQNSVFPDFSVAAGKTFNKDSLVVSGIGTASSISAWPDAFAVMEIVYKVDSGYAFFCTNIRRKIWWGEASGSNERYSQFSGMGSSG